MQLCRLSDLGSALLSFCRVVWAEGLARRNQIVAAGCPGSVGKQRPEAAAEVVVFHEALLKAGPSSGQP